MSAEVGPPEPARRIRARARSVVRSSRSLLLAAVAVCLVLSTPGATPVVTAAGTAGLPSASWDSLSASGSTLSAYGWAIDPDSRTAPVTVHVYVDGRWGAAVTADGNRPDVGAAFPGAGNAHGWSWSASVAPGQHSVCVYAIDVQNASRNTPLGCRTVAVQVTTPLGNWEALTTPYGTTISARGWAMDPDSRTTPVTMHVYVDGRWGGAVTADASRPDVGAAFPGAGDAHGWSSSQSVSPGDHTVCIYAIDVQNPSRNTPLGCRTVAVGVALPIGHWDGVSVSGTRIDVWGWALDLDNPTAQIEVRVHVDDRPMWSAQAWSSRPDVAAAFPDAGDLHGFSAYAEVTPGEHSVCVFAVEAGDFRGDAAGKAPLGCRTVGVQVTPPVGSYDALTASAGRLSAWGWALDLDHRSTVTVVHVYVDGRYSGEFLANGSRPDVGAAFPGAGDVHGWSFTAEAAPGAHSVCVFAIDYVSRHTPLGCRQVTVPPAA